MHEENSKNAKKQRKNAKNADFQKFDSMPYETIFVKSRYILYQLFLNAQY